MIPQQDYISVPLGSCVDMVKGYAFKSKWYTDVGVPIVKVSNFTVDSVDISNLVCIPDAIAQSYIKHELRSNDVVIQTVGSWPSQPESVVGKVIRIPLQASGSLLNQNAVQIIPRSPLDKSYLFYMLRDNNFKGYIVGTAQGAASQASITLASIRNYTFHLPPLPIQRKIAAVLSAYDDLIENNTRRIKILEEMASAIYREWFVEFRFPGHEGVEMVESELGLIPQGWEVGELGDLAESVRRNIKPSDINQETPYFGLEHLPRKSIALSNWDAVDSINSAKLAFKKGEILFGKIRPYFHKVGVAPLDGICSSDAIVIRPKRNECFATTLSCVSSEHFIEYATMTSQGTKMPRADWKVLVKYPVVIPPEQIIQRFSSFVRDVVDKIQNLIFRNKNLRQTRDHLLPKLISGEVDVSELDIEVGTNENMEVNDG